MNNVLCSIYLAPVAGMGHRAAEHGSVGLIAYPLVEPLLRCSLSPTAMQFAVPKRGRKMPGVKLLHW